MPVEVFALLGGLAVAVLLGRALAARIGAPDAAAYVLVGIVLGLIPGLPAVRLSPQTVLLVFLPPLIYFAGFFSDPRETVRHIGAVIGQSVFLVLATAAAAAGVVVLVFPDIGWAAALAFGAAIAPPDPVAATTVLQRLGVPLRVLTVLEAEGLINDAVALTVFTLALAATGVPITVGGILVLSAVQVIGGVVFGLLVAVAVVAVRKRISDELSHMVLSLATPFLAYIPATLAHSSGVLATVTASVWLGTRGRGVVAPTARLQTESFWRLLNLLLVAFLFVLLGTQVPALIRGVGGYPIGSLVVVTAGVVMTVITVRMLWVLAVPSLLRAVGVTGEIDTLPLSERLALGWCGPRGAVSLAVALSLPMTTRGGAIFPRRDLLLFLTIVVVLVTLVGQILTLPTALRWLRLSPDPSEQTQLLRVRLTLTSAALRELDTIDDEYGEQTASAQTLRPLLQRRHTELAEALEQHERRPPAATKQPEESDDHVGNQPPAPGVDELWLRVLGAERASLRDLATQQKITQRTKLAISQELDLDEARHRHT